MPDFAPFAAECVAALHLPTRLRPIDKLMSQRRGIKAIISVSVTLPLVRLVIGAVTIVLADSGPGLFDTYVEIGDGVLCSLGLRAHQMRYRQSSGADVV